MDVGGYRLDVAQSPHQLLQPGVTGSVVWDGGVMLCRCLEHWVDGNLLRLRGARVIDLGSGTGLVGIAAAALGANAVLTNQACMLRLLRENAARNTEEPLPGVVTVAELDWDDPQHSAAHREPTPLVVMAADCVFNEAIVPALLQTMAALAGPETLLLISLELRSDETHQVFLSLALAGFRVWRLLDSCLPPAMVCARAKVYVLTARIDEGVAAAGRRAS